MAVKAQSEQQPPHGCPDAAARLLARPQPAVNLDHSDVAALSRSRWLTSRLAPATRLKNQKDFGSNIADVRKCPPVIANNHRKTTPNLHPRGRERPTRRRKCNVKSLISFKKLERAEGFEPSTQTLATLCSTPELRTRPAPPTESETRAPASLHPPGRGDIPVYHRRNRPGPHGPAPPAPVYAPSVGRCPGGPPTCPTLA